MPDQSLARMVADNVKLRARQIAQDMAQNIGTPIDAQSIPRDQQIRLWNLQAPVDPAQVAQLVAAGQHSQAVDLQYPWRQKLIGPGSPTQRVERAEALAKQAMEGATDAAAPTG